MDHIQTINLLREKCRDFNLPLCLIYVDFEKAFESVEIDAILRSEEPRHRTPIHPSTEEHLHKLHINSSTKWK